MKGTTHLAIGAALGVAAGLRLQTDFETGMVWIAVSSLSALIPDLDGPSILSGKLSKFAKTFREVVLSSGILLVIGLAALYHWKGYYHFPLTLLGAALTLAGFAFREGFIRNALVSGIGAGLAAWGAFHSIYWLIGLGAYVAIAPWLKHRGLTHTLWAAAVWWGISLGFEAYVGYEGIATIAGLGYLSHLVADTLTPGGVKWLNPLVKKTFKLPFL
ncbi:metal-dependent hydrolase [Paenibacillus sp. CC-CFT747]|nr:metal-dependent hydrolase [Paenibacillus sp. CC-CFT747]